ncbi:MAG: hypothetical protein IKD80_05655 [Selenomonadaceae bacterium]|nr:hypothetical protein [Selenomonadaceae bacterium]
MAEMSREIICCLDWLDDEQWYFFDADTGHYVLTDKAPPEVRLSFEHWEKNIAENELRRKLESEWKANEQWYFYDEDAERYVLTDKASPEVRLSFEHWEKIVGVV